MIDERLKLLNGPDKKSIGELASPKLDGGGPTFEAGPGWGFYVKKWLKKYFLKIIAPALVVIIAIGILTANRSAETENGERFTATENIRVEVARGDSHTLLARKALVSYLKDHPEEALSNGQKVFIEEKIRQEIGNQKLVVGEAVEFATEDIKAAITQAKQLTQFQLQKWEEYAKRVRF